MAKFTTAQLAAVQIDYGLVYVDYGEVTERLLGPTRGGGTFDATQQIRDIEFDGRNGKSKGMQHVDFVDAMLKLSSLAISNDDLEVAFPYLTRTGTDPDFTYTCGPEAIGMVPDTAYFTNITMFAKLSGGGYKKITIYNAMNEAPFSLAAIPKGEAEVALEVYGHWETDDTATIDKLFDITEVASIT